MISGSASRMLLRMLASVLPRQSVNPAINWSIRSDGFIGSLYLEFCPVFMRVLLGNFLGERVNLSLSISGSVLLGRSLRNKPSKNMAFPHPKSRKDHYWNEEKPSRPGVVWNLSKRTINV